MATPAVPSDIATLLETLNPEAGLVERHVWLIGLLEWIRGNQGAPAAAVARVDLLLDLLDARPQTAQKLQAWWRALLHTVDGSTLLSDYGFGSRNAFVSELVDRLHHKLLPATPETADASELFGLVLDDAHDAQWLAALPTTTLQRLAKLLSLPAVGPKAAQHPGLTHWHSTLLDAMTFCTSQIRAAGFSPEIRLRMSHPAREASPFHRLAADLDAVRDAWLAGQDTQAAVHQFRSQLEACRHAAASVYTHLDAHGISVDLVFRLRQLRERVLRVRALLDCLLDDDSHRASARLLSHLASVSQEQRSIGALVASNSSLLAAKVAERSSETGEHYITRTRAEYRTMLANAAGGGALTALTTAMKFGIMALGLSAFWGGFWAGVSYAVSFVLIQLLHFTLATKQPAMTAPAMAAKLKDIADAQALGAFVDEVTHLVRSQVAAVIGNVAVVFPVAIALSAAMVLALGAPMISEDRAHYVLQSLTLTGPSLLFAAFTGVLLFSSSIIAGWVENWFVLHRLDSAIRHNPRITAWLGLARADRWALFMRRNISGLAANISLGFMLGLVPPILAFLGPALDVRHVTLSAGQLGAACAALGWEVVKNPALWWAAASIPFIGMLNVGVSFYLAFRVALQAHNVSGVGRSRIQGAVWARLRQAPGSFFWPARDSGA
ncbi:recombinase [Rhodoferax sp. TH121]|uniref:site-specific recombinase n=1 Tax=Rhodoferax sp. TH121 TaxID=2022803 RepID=UPI000B96AF2A|nr:site-specific recombinase [Rhodoferax sp. TH121]OYQ42827.1 recombinase [Rhodoferax sp. TH121]